MSDQTALASLRDYFYREDIRERFADVIGNSGAYIASVLLEVANSDALQACSHQSIYLSALQAATLRLSVDRNLGEAYLVPYKGQAKLIVGYKGMVELGIRTNRYRYINVNKIYEGEIVEEDRISGIHRLKGGKTGDKIIGWIAAFEMTSGYAKTLYMTVEEIHDHARKYSPGYDNPKGLWKKDSQSMERKTVLRLLLKRWGYLNPHDASVLAQVESQGNGEVIEGQAEEPQPGDRQDEQPVDDQETPAPVTPVPNAPAANGRPYAPEVVRQKILERAEKYQDFVPNNDQKNLLRYGLELCFVGEEPTVIEDKRHALLHYLVGNESTEEVGGKVFKAIVEDWLMMRKDSGGEYHINSYAAQEAQAIVRQALVNEGQDEFPL